MMNKLKRATAIILTFVMGIGLMSWFEFTVAAAPSDYGYGTNVLKNPTPTSNDYWERVGCSYGKYLNFGESEIIGANTGTDISVRQRVVLTDADVRRVNNGELKVKGSGKFYAQGSRTLTANLNIICYSAAGAVLHTYNARDKGYSASGRTITLKIDESLIPAGTTYIVYEGTEHLGSGNAFFGMYDFNMVFTDTTMPSVSNTPYLYSINGDTTLPAYVVPGNQVTYAMKFSEAVTVSAFPVMDLSIENGVSYDTTYSADRQTVYFTTTLSNTGTNTSLQLKKLANLRVKDDAGNESSFTYPSLSVGNVPYQSVFDVTSNLTHLSLSGTATARYGNAYSATLVPTAGYQLPENITVKVNGGVITDYSYNKSNGQIAINASAVVGGVEITATGTPQSYNITFDMQGGSSGTESIAATYTQGLSPVTPPTRAGYTFGGYYTEVNGGGVQYYSYDGNSTKTYDKTSDLTLYAKWSAKSYTVTLDATGGTGGGTTTAVYDADMPSITKPTKAGYTFEGYFTQLNGGGEKYYNADGTSAKKYDRTDGLMLYAKWSANSYTVTFDKQGGNGGSISETVTFNSAMPTIVPPTKIGYTFGGYYTGANGTGVQYYFANGESAKAYDIDGACTLYAKWTANTYDVVLNAQGGSGGSTVTATYGSDMPVIAAPDKPGYLFGGYFDEKNGTGTKYYNADCSSARTYDKAEVITLYALWTPNTYNIQLYSRGENVGTLKDVVYGDLRLPSAESIGISFANHNFVGWNIYDEQNWAMYTADRTYSAGLVTEQGKTAYIYAAWLEKDKYTITYDANGGGGAPAAIEVHADETITLSNTVPSRENYTFAGWSEKSESVSAQYQPNDSFTMGNSLVTLFAVWNKNPELTYHANGGSFSTYAGASYPAAGSTVALTSAVPKKDGAVFCGWAESATANADEIISSPYIMPNHNTVLYAVYEPIKYTVNVNAAAGYSVSGIVAGGYELGDYAEFTVSGANPKVYINGILSLPVSGKYKFEMTHHSDVVVCNHSAVNVVYNANNGVNAPIDMTVYTNGDTAVVASNTPVRTGYTFIGWASTKEADSAEYTAGESMSVAAEDIVLYAVWRPITYTIKYFSNGGSGNMTATAADYDTSVSLAENTFTKAGCQFVGWSYAADGELAYANKASVKNLTDTQNGEITLYAVWKGAETTVRFRFEGGSSGTAFCEAVYGELLPTDKLTAPNRYGYIFAGYYTAPNKGGNLVYNADLSLSEPYRSHVWDSVSSEFDLYAAWEPVHYTVAFVNGTETLADTVDAVYGQSFLLPRAEMLDLPVPHGYSFAGWSVASGSDMVYYRDGQEITTGLIGEDGAVVYLYAVIRKNVSYRVTLPASAEGYQIQYNGAELTSQTDIEVNPNEDISFTVSVEAGYTADKMTILANGIMLGATQISGRTYSYSIKNISADTSVNIYHVKKESFRILLNNGTGYSVSPKSAAVESGNDFSFTVTLSEGYKTATPMVFVNGQELNGTKNADGFTYTICGVTAQPVISISVVPKHQYAVTFISNGSIYSISTVEQNAKVSQPSLPERYGYTFGGWYTDRDFTLPYDFQTEIVNAVTLYAKWTANTYTVEYNKNTTEQVSVPNEQTKEHDAVLIISSVIPSRVGYTFVGWNTRADGTGTSYGVGNELNVNSNITLYAQWKINRYTVTLITGEGVTGTISANEVAYKETVTITATSGNNYNPPVITAVPHENAELISEGIYRITGPVSFVSIAEVKTIYTASFYLDGGLYYTQSAIEGSMKTVVLPNPPTKYGYVFTGWYTEQTGGVAVDESTVLDRNMSVYARFEVNTRTITPAQSGTGYEISSTDSTTVNYGGDYTFTVTIAEHYNADNMRVYANGVLLVGSANGNVHSYAVRNISADTVISVWGVKADVYTVLCLVDGESYHSEQVEYRGNARKPKAPVKTGYAFDGWFVGGQEWNFANYIEDDLALEAKFTPLTYRLTVPMSQSEFTVTVTSDNPVVYGGSFTFEIVASAGYNVSDMLVYANGVLLEKDSENENMASFCIANIDESKVLSVRGIGQNTYAVTYRANTTDYVGNMPENVIKTYGDDIVISDLVPERYGYDFIGWATSAHGAVQYNGGDVYSENSDFTLYAVWREKAFAVSFETNGGSINGGEFTEYSYGSGITLPTAVVKEGYDFAGWYEDPLLQGVRVYEITASDYGDKNYYAAYTIADVIVNGYTGEYDGNMHDITYALPNNLSVEKYQWYFVSAGTDNAVAIPSDSYNRYGVKDVADSGEYYCYIETLVDGYVIRFFTEKATVKITKKPISVKADDGGKVYDAQPLTESGIALTGGSSLVEGHTIAVVLSANSTITKVGTQANVIELVTILDRDGNSVTENYEIIKQNGLLSVTPLTLSVAAENISVSIDSTLNQNKLYKIGDVLGNEKLSLANTSVTAKNESGETVAFADITKNVGTYIVTMVYSGFAGEGSENYTGSGTITSEVTVCRRSGGSGSGGASGAGNVSPDYTIHFDTDRGREIASQVVKASDTVSIPKAPEKEGYVFGGWYTDEALTTPYDFSTKVTKSFTLYAKWIEKEPDTSTEPIAPAAPEWKNPFTDVKEDEWYYAYVKYAAGQGLLKGTSSTSFAPDELVTRAMLVTVLYRAEGEPEITGTATFDDVDGNEYYANAVVWGQQNGIVNGVSKTKFAPDDNITREQIAAIMYRYARYRGYDISVGENTNILSYADFDSISEYAIEALQYASGAGLMKGKSDTTLNPIDNATRAEIATILQRFFERNH